MANLLSKLPAAYEAMERFYGDGDLMKSPELDHPTAFAQYMYMRPYILDSNLLALIFSSCSFPQPPLVLSRRIRKLLPLWRESRQRIPAPIHCISVGGWAAGLLGLQLALLNSSSRAPMAQPAGGCSSLHVHAGRHAIFDG